MYIATIIEPSILLRVLPIIKNIQVTILIATSNIISEIDRIFIVIGCINEESPKTNKMLKILEPKAFPTAKSLSPLSAATTLVISSGKDVPMATMVSPISALLMPKDSAISLAESTTSLPPKIIATSPKSDLNRDGKIGN